MNIKANAEYFYILGLNVTLLSTFENRYNYGLNKLPSKTPCHKWKEYQVVRQTISDFESLPFKISNGIGCVLGFNNLACIDIDDCNDFRVVENVLRNLFLPEKYEWVVETPNGYHIYVSSINSIFSHELMGQGSISLKANRKFDFEKIEIRWAGHSVLPSINKKYKFTHCGLPKNAPLEVSDFLIVDLLAEFCGEYESYYIANRRDRRGSRGVVKIKNFYCETTYYSSLGFEQKIKYNNITTIKSSSSFINESFYPKKYYLNKNNIIILDLETNDLINDRLDYESQPKINELSIFISSLNSVSTYNNPESKIEIITLLNKCNEGYTTIVSHNIDFDLEILDGYFGGGKDINPFRSFNTFCTMKTYSDNGQKEYLKLDTLYFELFDDYFNRITYDTQEDVQVIKRCFYIMDLLGYTK